MVNFLMSDNDYAVRALIINESFKDISVFICCVNIQLLY